MHSVLVSVILHNSYFFAHSHTSCVHSVRVSEKDISHDAEHIIKTHKESVEMSCSHLCTGVENDSEKSE